MNEHAYIHWLPALEDIVSNTTAKTGAQQLTEWGVPGIAGFITTAKAWHEATESKTGMTDTLAASLAQAYKTLSSKERATVTACAAHHRLELGQSKAVEIPDSQSLIDFCQSIFRRAGEKKIILVARQWFCPALVGAVSSQDREGLGLMTVEARYSKEMGHEAHDHYIVFKPLLGAKNRTPIVESVAAKGEPTSRFGGSRFILDADEVLTLARWAAKIEKRLGKAIRMEWIRGPERGALHVLAVKLLPRQTANRRTADTGKASVQRGIGFNKAIEPQAIGRGIGWARVDDILENQEELFASKKNTEPDTQTREKLIQSIAEAAAYFGVLAYPNEAVLVLGNSDPANEVDRREALDVMCQGVYRARAEMGLENIAVVLSVGSDIDAIGDGLRTMAWHGLIRGEAGLRVYLRWEQGLAIATVKRFCDGLIICDKHIASTEEITSTVQAIRSAGLAAGVCVNSEDANRVEIFKSAGATWVASVADVTSMNDGYLASFVSDARSASVRRRK